jgi:hypothetical protein
MIAYRVDWLPDEDKPNNIEIKYFGDNLKAAQAFARRKSAKGTSCYVIESRGIDRNGYIDRGQWAYHNGFTYGFES